MLISADIAFPFCGASSYKNRLLDHLVGAGEHHRGQLNSHRPGSTQVYSQIELGGTLERQIAWFCAFEHTVELRDQMPGPVCEIRPERHEAAVAHPIRRRKDRWLVGCGNQLDDLGHMSAQHNIRNEYECIETGENFGTQCFCQIAWVIDDEVLNGKAQLAASFQDRSRTLRPATYFRGHRGKPDSAGRNLAHQLDALDGGFFRKHRDPRHVSAGAGEVMRQT